MIFQDEDLLQRAKRYTDKSQDFLLNDTLILFHKLESGDAIQDYSFLLAPIAKAYEGFLKDFFLHIGLIDLNLYEGDRFRVGKTLNPSLRYKRFSIFQRLSQLDDHGEELAEKLWDAWKQGRNEALHFFVGNTKKLSLEEAVSRIHQVLQAIVEAGEFLATQDIKTR